MASTYHPLQKLALYRFQLALVISYPGHNPTRLSPKYSARRFPYISSTSPYITTYILSAIPRPILELARA